MGLHQAFLGVELLDQEIRLAEVRGSGHEASIAATAVHPLPPGLVQMGQVTDPAAVGQELRRTASEAGMRSRLGVLVTPDSRMLCRVLSLPPVRDRDLTGLVEYEVQERLHLPFPDPVWDYAALPRAKGDSARTVMVTAAPREVVDGLTGATAAAGLKPVAVDIAPLALRRMMLLVCPAEALSAPYMVLRLVPGGFSLHIFQGSLLVYSRFVPTVELPAAPEKAASAVLGEVEQALRFYLYSLNGRDRPVAEIWLVDAGEGAGQMAERLSRSLDLPVHLLPGGALTEGLSSDVVNRCAVAIGLALKGVRA